MPRFKTSMQQMMMLVSQFSGTMKQKKDIMLPRAKKNNVFQSIMVQTSLMACWCMLVLDSLWV